MTGQAASREARRRAGPGWFVVLLILAIALSSLARANDRLPGDLWLTRRAQDLPGVLEGPAKAIRLATSTETVLILGVLLAGAMLVPRRRRFAIYAAATLALLPLLQSGLKDLVGRPRPDPALVAVRDTFTSASFPSGHVMSGTVLLALLALAVWQSQAPGSVRLALAWGCGALAALNGLANVYMGVHWPSDVLGGYLWAGALLVGVGLMVRGA